MTKLVLETSLPGYPDINLKQCFNALRKLVLTQEFKIFCEC